MTYQQCAAAAAARLTESGLEAGASRGEVAILARSLLAWDHARWLTDSRNEAPGTFAERLEDWVARRARHEPVAYIVGEREFFGRAFRVTPDVLIPRPDTETIVTTALRCLADRGRSSPRLVDIGTGSGCLAATLAAERPDARVVATDVSSAALDVARDNARRLQVDGRIDFRLGSLFAGMTDSPDLVVSNPPYVREDERLTLPPDVVEYEPHDALFAGPEGLDVIRLVVEEGARRLTPGGWLVVEIGSGQASAVKDLVTGTGDLALEEIVADIESRPRVVVARRR